MEQASDENALRAKLVQEREAELAAARAEADAAFAAAKAKALAELEQAQARIQRETQAAIIKLHQETIGEIQQLIERVETQQQTAMEGDFNLNGMSRFEADQLIEGYRRQIAELEEKIAQIQA